VSGGAQIRTNATEKPPKDAKEIKSQDKHQRFFNHLFKMEHHYVIYLEMEPPRKEWTKKQKEKAERQEKSQAASNTAMRQGRVIGFLKETSRR
jgi:hypothetical protein